ncbi:MAG: Gfo/Idh/MocA family oxidoreductase [candidate division KSB1 bacterium]|nr:Gfo/Idh/MocA family oxidoreductase [candidate division KSB1 bacterium]MDZ7287039.1 Gfo/Idh/MocA family oxidoreductase [candidate division KSB1 bacterium]MDZ7297036.1 Gfo/Idh/MocA family oxidoreductase [candidate division KSB1 bacterium]MDZ7352208.1 Gfo/Idh/MocA family oxidoreductase [candidate division KSB1 bacterium]MDZ7383637.1 Gfo/Idh/MocA family oxidoreductase [candidate division KSB1 bacterium]
MRNGFLIVGLGSIGRVHLRNLIALGQRDIILCRTGKSTLPPGELSEFLTVSSLEQALERRPLAAFITNPTALHLPTAILAAQAGCHLFVEKPVSHTAEGVRALAQLVAQQQLCAQVGFQFRFHPALQQVRLWLKAGALGRVISAHVHWGEYLPDWHPWEDYRRSYSALTALGGGVIATLCHPFDYLRWLLGEVESVLALSHHSGCLAVEAEDLAEIILRFASGVIGSIHLDYLQRPPRHTLEIIGELGTIRWDYGSATADFAHAASGQNFVYRPANGFERNSMFLAEMREFLACLETAGTPSCHLRDGIRALEIALAAKQSSQERREIHVQRLV